MESMFVPVLEGNRDLHQMSSCGGHRLRRDRKPALDVWLAAQIYARHNHIVVAGSAAKDRNDRLGTETRKEHSDRRSEVLSQIEGTAESVQSGELSDEDLHSNQDYTGELSACQDQLARAVKTLRPVFFT
jgi:hypothetical protein